MSDIIFTKPLSGKEFGDLMTLDEFLESVEEFFFMDDDGFGLPVKDNMVADFVWADGKDNRVWPSQADQIPAGTTHILWFQPIRERRTMKTLIELLKEDLEIARRFKFQDQINLTKVILGECDRLGKDLPNDQVLGVMQKILKNSKILNEARPSKESGAEVALIEECIGKVYELHPELKPQEIDLDAIIAQLIADNPGQYETLKEKPQNIGWFVGQVMKATQGKANPTIVKDKILDRL